MAKVISFNSKNLVLQQNTYNAMKSVNVELLLGYRCLSIGHGNSAVVNQ